MSKRHLAYRLGITFVDTTVKSGSLDLFSPTWNIVLAFKGGEISWEEYSAAYRQLMIESARREPVKWLTFLRTVGRVAIGCYCAKGENCHRHLLTQIFQDICTRQNIPFLYYGELE